LYNFASYYNKFDIDIITKMIYDKEEE